MSAPKLSFHVETVRLDARAHTAARVIALTLVGAGEALLRLEKRLHCAAAGAGVMLELNICKDAEALGIPYDQTPAVVLDGQMVLNGLPRTEEIEAWLRLNFTSGNTWSSPER